MLCQRELLGDRHLNRQASQAAFVASICSETVKLVYTSTVHDGDGGPLSGVTEGMHCIEATKACLSSYLSK